MKVQFKQTGGAMSPYLAYTPFVPQSAGPVDLFQQQQVTTKQKDNDDLSQKDLLEMVSKIEGLPSDMRRIYKSLMGMYQLKKAFPYGTNDLVETYLSSLMQIKEAKFNQEQFKNAYTVAKDNIALSEVAITPTGRLVAYNAGNKQLEEISVQDFLKNRNNYQLLTNNNLLGMRAQLPNYAFNNSVLQTVENGVGISKVAEFLRQNLKDMGSDKSEYSQEVTKGAQALQQLAGLVNPEDIPSDGTVTLKISSEDQRRAATHALNYLYTMLPTNMRTLLQLRTGNVDDPEAGVKQIIQELILIPNSASSSTTIDLTLPKKSTTKSGSGSGGGSTSGKEAMPYNPYMLYIQGRGGTQTPFRIRKSRTTATLYTMGRTYNLYNVKEDESLDKVLSSGLEWITANGRGSVTFGDQPIDSGNLKDILIKNNGATVVMLPCKITSNGSRIVNFEALDTYDQIIQEVNSKNYTSEADREKAIADKIKNSDISYMIDSSTGLVDKNQLGLFITLDGITTDKANLTNTESQYIAPLKQTDELVEQIREGLATGEGSNKKPYVFDINNWYDWNGYDHIYEGTVFIPLSTDVNNAWVAYDQGKQIDEGQARYNAEQQQIQERRNNLGNTNSSVL